MNCPPVLFLIFNRPEVTARVFARIREARPKQLFVAADGPRSDCRGDAAQCDHARECVDQVIDWPCETRRLYRERNYGCRKAVSSAIDWFFEHVEKGVILEDDCHPEPSFFPFCAELLDRYRNDTRIMQIAGTNLGLIGEDDIPGSYCFSRFGPIWGWATWRRAWTNYDVNMASWPKQKEMNFLSCVCTSPEEIEWRTEQFNYVYEARIDTWDYQWQYSKMIERGLTVIPRANLISNVGFSVSATHTKLPNRSKADLPTRPIDLPLIHPETVAPCFEFDDAFLNQALAKSRISDTFKRTLRPLIPIVEFFLTKWFRRYS